MAKIEIYTKMMCPYCSRAKALLKSKGASFEDIPAYMNAKVRAEMRKRAHGANTCLLYTSPSPRDATLSRMPSSA